MEPWYSIRDHDLKDRNDGEAIKEDGEHRDSGPLRSQSETCNSG